MRDIVQRLRSAFEACEYNIFEEATAEIERLRKCAAAELAEEQK